MCYNDLGSNCLSGYGRLYPRDDAQTACPPGWLLPSDDDRSLMLNSVEKVFGGTQDHTNTAGGASYGNGTYAGKLLQAILAGTSATDTL